MGEVAARWVSIYPKIGPGFASTIRTEVQRAMPTALAPVDKASEASGKTGGKKFGDAFRTVAAPILAVATVGAIANFVGKSVDAFAQLQDATGAAGVVFGDALGSIQKQADGAATAMGISKQQATDAAITFGTFGKSAGLAGQDLAGFSTQMVQLAGDMASFRGTSPEQAIEAIGAAMRGESEPIRAYGVLLDDATLKNRALSIGLISTTKDALTPQNRVLAAQAEILAQTSDAQGDFARTSQSTANVAKTLAAESANLSAEIGEKLAPAIVEAQKAGIGLIRWATDNQAVLVPLAGTLALVAAGVAGVIGASKAMGALKTAKQAVSALGDAYQAMGTKARTATLAAGGIGLALTAASVIYGAWAQEQERAKAQTEAFTESLRADSGALGENTRAAVANQLATSDILTNASKMGISSDAMTDAILGNAKAYEFVTGKMREYLAANADNEGAITGAKTEIDSVNSVLGDMSGRLQEAQANYASYATSADVATTATQGNTTATTAAVATFRDLVTAANESATALLGLSGSQIGFEAAIDSASDAVKRNGRTLDITTAKGRDNRRALDEIAISGLGVVKSLQDTGASSDEVSGAMDRTRTSFIAAAKSMGLTKDEANELADELKLIKSKNVTVSATVNLRKGTGVTYNSSLSVDGTGQGKWTLRSGGGKIPGLAMADYDDRVPSLLTPEEWVIQRRAARHYGDSAMRAINSMQIPRSALAGYASGGKVGSAAEPALRTATSTADLAAAMADALSGVALRFDRIDHLADYFEARIVSSLRRG